MQFITFAGKFLSKISPSIDCHCRNLEAHVVSENSHDGEEPLMLLPGSIGKRNENVMLPEPLFSPRRRPNLNGTFRAWYFSEALTIERVH